MTTDIIEKIKAAGVEVKVLSSAQMQQVLKAYEGRVAGRQAVLSNEPFYSNAEHAVRSIRQDKATPAQWLAMLSKNGGIKAGEDRWLGMTDWLRQSTEKTLTKEHVLNYIEKNRIALHEAYYGEIEQTEDFKKLDDEYRRMINEVEDNYLNADDRLEEFYMEMHEKYEEYDGQWMMDMTEYEKHQEEELLALRDKYDTSVISAEEIAFSEMVEKYGRHFDNAFIGDENGLTVNDEEETRFFIDELPIDPVRREHVTEGLVNYHEIALWAEQADAWRPSDNIHFGDAGGGKCIGWVRFGETTIQTPLSDEGIQKNLQSMAGPEKWMKFSGEQFVTKHDLYYPPGVYSYHVKSPYVSKGPKEEDEYYYHPLKGRAVPCKTLQEAVDQYNLEHVQRTETKKVLVIDEVQSNRHQQASRKKTDGQPNGYLMTDKERETLIDELAAANKELVDYQDAMRRKYNSESFGHYLTKEELHQLSLLEQKPRDLMVKFETDKFAVPRAPFEKNWHELCMKRMLHYAAENGFDMVAWTKGIQQAKRYDLTKYVDSIGRDKDHDEDKYVIIRYNSSNETGFYVKPDGMIFDSPTGWDGKHISEVLGKEMAEKVLAMPENTRMDVKDYRIGGKGMDTFYDKVLPNFMNSYVKRWGTSVSEVDLSHLNDQGDEVWHKLSMHSVEVTPAMRESVLQGQPMFMHDHKGELYGFAVGDTIFLSEKGLNPETVLHEYTHLWAKAMQQGNPQGWQSVKDLLRDTALWREVMSDPLYADIRNNEDYVASEALARISGRDNAAKLARYAQQTSGQHPADVFVRLKAALERFWAWVGKEMLGIKRFSSVGEVADRVLYDMMKETRITEVKLYKDLQGNTCIRCRIDGEQQMGRRVDGLVAEIHKDKDTLLHMAESCFAEELNRKYEKKEGQTFKR